jgi:cell division protein FtsW (lipid II flippase)/cell division protein FtsI/penicillin-binding protein 2
MQVSRRTSTEMYAGKGMNGRAPANLSPADLTREKATRGHALADLIPTHSSLADLPLGDSSNERERLLLVLAGLFLLTGAVTLALAGLGHWSLVQWSLVGVWAVCFGAAHLLLCRYTHDRDPLLLPLAGLLTGLGLLLIARLADVTFLLRQSIWLAISTAVFLLIATRPPRLRWLRRYRYTWLLGGLALLATTLIFGTNPSGYGPRLWLGGYITGLGSVFFQPSEILKLLMVVYLASYLAEKRELVLNGPQVGRMRLPSLPYLAPLLAMWGLAMVLLAWQQDLGAALLFFLTFLVMLYQASSSWGYVAAGLVLFFIAIIAAYALFDTVALRVDIWLNPWADPDGRAFQIVQSLIAFASGGLMGQGLGQGSPTFIPAVHTDFPFTAIAEELGLAGTLGMIAAYAVLTLDGVRIALNARTPFRRLLAAGLATLLGIQAWIIMAGSAKLIPLTGVTLPFVSYGGSSLLSSFIALGLLTTVSRDERSETFLLDTKRPSVMTAPIRRLGLGLLVLFAGLAAVSGYWALVRQEAIRSRDDNPRLVIAEQHVHRGPIFDRHGVVLARSQATGNGIQQRIYLTPTVPTVGYYNLKHGVGGIEASADSLLRGLESRSEGDLLLDELLHRQPDGQGIALTIDAELQKEVAAAMKGTGSPLMPSAGTRPQGAAVLVDVASGEILALVSQPTYDPNTLDADWEQLESDPAAPLLNRATQGLYQPGGVLQPVVLAAGLEADAVSLEAPVGNPDESIMIDGRSLDCTYTPDGETLADAFAAVCPAPLAELGATLGAQVLETAFRQWGLDAPPALEIPTEAGDVQVTDPRLAAVGQEGLTVTPLQLALVTAAIGNEGVMPPAQLVLKTESTDGRWQVASPPGQPVQVISPDLAERLRTLLRPAANGQVLGHSSLALAGADRPSHAWYLGLAPAQAPRYAVVVLLEHGGEDGLVLAEQIGSNALLAALNQAP